MPCYKLAYIMTQYRFLDRKAMTLAPSNGPRAIATTVYGHNRAAMMVPCPHACTCE